MPDFWPLIAQNRLMSLKQELQKKLAEDRLEDVLQALVVVLADRPQLTTVLQNQARYNDLQNKLINGLIAHGDYTLTRNEIRFSILAIVNDIDRQNAPAEATENKISSLHPRHQHTCDRVDQSDLFQKLFEENQKKKTHYYYIYGHEYQSHKGLAKRFAYHLEGRLQDYLNPDLDSGRTVLHKEITFNESNDLEVYKKNILKNLFASFCDSVDAQESLLQKNLKDLWSISPALQALSEKDCVCILLLISEWEWKPDITPEAARWFINSFCEVELPAKAPAFVFFFGMLYEEDDGSIEEEIREAIHKSEHIRELPELDMVGLGDVEQWLFKYKVASRGRARKQLLKEYFLDNPELEEENRQNRTFYMEDVELELQKIIDRYNKDGPF